MGRHSTSFASVMSNITGMQNQLDTFEAVPQFLAAETARLQSTLRMNRQIPVDHGQAPTSSNTLAFGGLSSPGQSALPITACLHKAGNILPLEKSITHGSGSHGSSHKRAFVLTAADRARQKARKAVARGPGLSMCLQICSSQTGGPAQGLPGIRPNPPSSRHSPAPTSVTAEDVQRVHTLVEHCILRGCTKQRTVLTLQVAGVHPAFVTIVWEKLEAQNQAFFAAYNRLLRRNAEQAQTDNVRTV